MIYRFQPIDQWPREFTKHRRRASFSASYQKTLDRLGYELEKIGAKESVIMAAFREEDIRLDGLIRSSARVPAHPGIIIAASTKHGDLKWACDEFFDWQANIRAIGLTLERLRLADLYGVTKRGEQYRGWKALPDPLVTPPPMSEGDAIMFLEKASHLLVRNKEEFVTAYRAAAKNLHADANGGEHLPSWNVLQQAKAVLDNHFAKKP